jgi:hypothetical protein
MKRQRPGIHSEVEPRKDRAQLRTIFQGSLCTESGCYLVNFKGCGVCGTANRALDSMTSVDRTTSEQPDDDVIKESVQFKRKQKKFSC